jgi:CheY-like chemotaxis protein
MCVGQVERSRILVVDDDPDVLAFYRDVLERAGYRVSTAQSAGEARQEVTAHPPDALVLDIAMPGGDGLSLAEQLYEGEATRSIPIVIVTALSSFGGSHMLMELDNIRRVLFKPFPADVLVTGVDDVLRWGG